MIKLFLAAGSLFAMLSVILGAFAAHGLKSKLGPDMLGVFQTGVQYQFYHALGLLAVGLLLKFIPGSLLGWSGGLMIAGIVCFSGSLYMLALTGIKWFGPITPLGGLFFVIGWLLMLVAVLQGEF